MTIVLSIQLETTVSFAFWEVMAMQPSGAKAANLVTVTAMKIHLEALVTR